MRAESCDHTAKFEVQFEAGNAVPRFVFIHCLDDITKRYFFFLSDADREAGKITIPADTVAYSGSAWVILASENPLRRISAILNNVTIT